MRGELAGVDHGGVERQRDALGLGGFGRAREVVGELAELLAEQAFGPLERLLGREPVDDAVELVVVEHGLLVERRDERATVRLDGDPTLLLQRDRAPRAPGCG